MPTGSTTTNQVAPTNSPLNAMFSTLFGGTGGAGSAGVTSLRNIAGGQNVQQLNAALTSTNNTAFKQNVASIKEAFGSNGMGSSSALANVLAQAATQNATTLSSNIAQADLTASGQQLGAAQYLAQIFSSAANEYYNSRSTKTDSGMSTFINLFSTLFPGGV